MHRLTSTQLGFMALRKTFLLPDLTRVIFRTLFGFNSIRETLFKLNTLATASRPSVELHLPLTQYFKLVPLYVICGH